MKGRSLIITGADGALGRIVTNQLLLDGWTLYASSFDTKSEQTLHDLFKDEIGKTVFTKVADLSNETHVNEFVAGAKDVFGLVHIAGGYRGGNSIADYSVADFDFLINLNAKPTFLLLKEIVPVLKQNKGGAIITIGAKPVIHQAKGNALYTASKSAVVGMTLSVAEECREDHIRANCILPATLQTPNNLSWADEKQFKTFTPLQDVADTISFLVSERGKGITGMTIPMYNEIHA